MSQTTNPLNLNTDISPLVQKLGRHADVNRDGKVSGSEFAEFLDQVLHPDQPSTPAMKMPAPYRDRMLGFDGQISSSPSASTKSRAAAIAQYLAPTPENLRQMAKELGPSAGLLSPDGLSLLLAGGEGTIGVRDRGNGAVWQWMARDLSLPSGA